MRTAFQALGFTSVMVIMPAVAYASQGPGVGGGTATAWTQLAMAVAVYGGAGIMVVAGLIGAVRQGAGRTERHG
jgi:hypothetical protein